MARDDVRIVSRETAYQGYVRVEQLRLRHKLFAGGWSDEMPRELVDRGHAAAVLPYDPVADAVVLIEQFRVGAMAADREPWMIEIVAGIIEDSETPEEVVRREALEEAGCTVTDLMPAGDFLTSPGILSETISLFVGRTGSAGIGGIHGLDHEHEDIRAFVTPFDSIRELLDGHRIANVTALVALQWLLLNRDKVRNAWQ